MTRRVDQYYTEKNSLTEKTMYLYELASRKHC